MWLIRCKLATTPLFPYREHEMRRIAVPIVASIGLFGMGCTAVVLLLPLPPVSTIVLCIVVFVAVCSLSFAAAKIIAQNLIQGIDYSVTEARRQLEWTDTSYDAELIHDTYSALPDSVRNLLVLQRDNEMRCRDMTSRLVEHERLTTLGELAAGVAHEINNPLGGIMVYAHLLLEDTDPEDPRYQNIRKIVKESERCRQIVLGLLNYARQNEPVLSAVSVNSILQEALNNMKNDPAFEGANVVRAFDDSLPMVQADASQIQEVFENIVRNALDVMDDGGNLRICTRTKEVDGVRNQVEILFEDSGPGIPEDCIDKIFDPFFTTKGKGHGTGLGLSVSYGIVKRHHGSIEASNCGTGAVMTVVLPCGGHNS